ncbi:blue copper protein-like [Quercus lobata]|uniref:blue copper protein-like n=1 Tax=Quercus lobata TaxID=97700 RepID=UPI0012491EE5|nr:blue copper protein-like [Quercus lobata]
MASRMGLIGCLIVAVALLNAFNVTNGTHSVAKVSEAEYNACTKVTSVLITIASVSFGYTLETAGTYYIICTISNHCEQGQKFSFKVESTGSPPNSASSLTVGALLAVLTTTAISFLTYF